MATRNRFRLPRVTPHADAAVRSFAEKIDSVFRQVESILADFRVTAAETVPWLGVSDPPTTLEGYGITDAASDAELSTHAGDTTGVHGIPDTSLLETQAGATSKVANSMSAHLAAADPHAQYLTPAEGAAAYDAAGAASSAVSAHVAAADPHAQYQLESALLTAVQALLSAGANITLTNAGGQISIAVNGGVARYNGTAAFTGSVLASAAAGAYLGVLSGTTGAVRVSNGSNGWYIYASDGDGALYFSDEAETVLLGLRTDGSFVGVTALSVEGQVDAFGVLLAPSSAPPATSAGAVVYFDSTTRKVTARLPPADGGGLAALH